MVLKSNRSKACDFDLKTKQAMLERDNYRCIFCSSLNVTPAHYLPRSAGGLGILENGVCLCVPCHQALDNGVAKKHLNLKVRRYLDKKYPGFTDVERTYNRREWLK
jgi:5-methylcytosine-specific restriction endonuclease McrA